MIIKKCELCGNEFETKAHNAKFCSQKCKLNKYSLKSKENKKIYIKKCVICNNEFETNKKNQRFCKNDHYIKCFICNEEFLLMSYKEGRTKYSCGHPFCIQEITRYNMSVKNNHEWKPKPLTEKNKVKTLEKKKCRLCGEQFTPSVTSQEFCRKRHKTNCEYCGEEFTIRNLKRPEKTCSIECATYLSAEKRNEIVYDKICEYCGKEFQSKASHALYCEGPHYSTCEVCGEEFLVADINSVPRTCSNSCASSLTHTDKSRQIRKENSLMKYGTEHTFQAELIKEKIRATHEERWGGIGFASKKLSADTKQIIMNKYGVENVSQLKEIKEKKKQTLFENYGVYNPAGIHINNYEDWHDFGLYVQSNSLKFDCFELAEYFNVPMYSIRNKSYETEVMGYVKDFYKYSNPELIIKHMLLSFNLKEGIDFLPHNRHILGGLELDFYLPNHNIAIEVSPTYTHNSLVGWGGYGDGLSEMYHYDKFRLCSEKNIQLFTLFDWINIDIFKSALKDKLGLHQLICINEIEYQTDVVLDSIDIKNNLYSHNKYNTVTISNKNEVLLTSIWLENINKGTAKLKYLECNENYSKMQLMKMLLTDYKKTAVNQGINQIIIKTDSNIENGNIYKEEGFVLIKEIRPRVNYYNEKYEHHIKRKKIIKQKKNILENYGYLPVYDCGHKLWQLNIG